MQWKYDNSFDSFSLNVGPSLASRGIDLDTDITEMIYMVKNDAADLDADALVTLTLGDGITKNLTDSKVVVKFRSTDFGEDKLKIRDCSYLTCLGFKTSETTTFVEFTLGDKELQIVQDYIRG